ncbi:asparagine synthase (glutamine-hydrolyzing), partial [Streptomyces sp. NPDC059468]
MCGISGWVSFDRDLTTESTALHAMTETMACRGPDDRGTWAEGPAALGHRRLAIIDLPGGRQPMSVRTPEGAVALVYSGEAYNFTELRRELTDRGHRFTTDSDTEVVLHGYLEWGDAVAERLNGMYAFAVWDGRHDRLVMIRDRMGIKPFYYHPTPDGVLFGSEPKAILANPLARPRVALDGLREMFTMVKTPGHAVWDGMHEVEPGTVVTVDRAGLRTRVYWRLETRAHSDDRDTTVATVRSLLDDIVRRQLVADVPRCTLLSGGLDSSAMTALAARQLAEHGEKVRSFSVDFVGQTDNFVADELRGTPDTPFVHDVARLACTDHQDIVLDAQSLADPGVREKVIRARDLPAGFGDMDTSLLLLFRAIRDQSTVALSGESADEVFGGYLQFFDEEARRAETFPWLVHFGRHFGDDAGVLRPDLAKTLDLERYIADGYRTAVAAIHRLDGESDFEYRMRQICHLHLTRFVRTLLDRKDRMSMAVGLEVRVPYCDHRLVEYVYNTPWSLKSFDGREKSLLREATADLLPRSVYDRVK